MPGDGKTELQRDILLTWYNNPDATNQEIADACDCSASYVSQIKNRFDDYNEMEAMLDRQDKEMEQIFGDDIFDSLDVDSGGPSLDLDLAPPTGGNGQQSASVNRDVTGPGLAEQYDQLPDNAVGYLTRVIILMVMLYVVYQVATVLLF